MQIKRLAVTLVTVLCLASSGQAAERLNILWIIGEDLGPDLACYGEKAARTPNLDRLAAEGARYNNAYATAPICSAARSAFCTGMYQTSFGAHHHRSHRDDDFHPPADVRLISERLRDAGYFTGNLQKLPESLGFSAKQKTDWNFTPNGKAYDTSNWDQLPKHQPFYAQINLAEAHREYHKSAGDPTDPARVTLPPYLADDPESRDDWACYLDALHELDRKVGAILKLLDDSGLRENTVVIFFGDNGRECLRGKYFAYDQGVHVPLIVRWPGHVNPGAVSDDLVSLIDVTATSLAAGGVPVPRSLHGIPFLGPEAKKRQYVFAARDRIDETPDRVRTVRDARFRYIRNFRPELPHMQRMIYAELTNPNVLLMRRLYAEGKLTTVQAAFLAPSRKPEELYDLQADSFELHNLAGDPKYANELDRLRSVLDAWMIDTNDQGRTPEDPAVEHQAIAEHDAKMQQMLEKRFKKPMSAK
jgi:arylsulfatase A-like enzyme